MIILFVCNIAKYFFSESPRDASNKDSPASQADSGVFSIASSNSPSKEGGASGTSPDSPNRIVYSGDLNRDNQCKYCNQMYFGSLLSIIIHIDFFI